MMLRIRARMLIDITGAAGRRPKVATIPVIRR
jgi:hypothetical protein